MPHLAHLAVAVVLSIVFILITLMVTAADFELNPVSNRWLAAADSSVEVSQQNMQAGVCSPVDCAAY